MKRGPVQQTLFAPPAVDETRLRDEQRTVLEAIDTLGAISVEHAGRIHYHLRGWTIPPTPWLPNTGYRILKRLRKLGLVRRRRADGLWIRNTTRGRRKASR